MPKESSEGLTSKKSENISEWFEQVCLKAELADFSKVKGTMVIRPRGYNIWQSIQDYFNKNIIDKTGAENAYFPLFIPESFFHKEAEHAKGFSPEVAWIDKELTGEGERIAIRPTSETIMYDSYSNWIRSYNDLPLRINQWCNIVRWETEATKLLLRSREFLWQEGHCVYETEEECEKETLMYIKLYQKLCRDLLALPVVVGKKSEKEKFAGAKNTYTIEAFMPDSKALQCGTSHNLGQGFAKAFEISYVGKDEKKHLPWQNSWGLSTRLIGGTVMTHSDDAGLVLPPRVCKNKAVIIPLLFKGKEKPVLKVAEDLKKELSSFNPILDDRADTKPGYKYNEWEMKGIPLRIEIGPRDLENKSVMVVKRNTKEKLTVKLKDLKKEIPKVLEQMHEELYDKAKEFLDSSIQKVETWDEFKSSIKENKIVGCSWCGETSCEEKIKDELGGVSTRCIPLDSKAPKNKKCPHCGKDAKVEMYFSRSY
jgi:prolyl-tRNA synthetase